MVMTQIWMLIPICALLLMSGGTVANTPMCNHIKQGTFDECTQAVFKHSPGWRIEAICKNTTEKGNSNLCRNESICNKTFSLSIFNQQLYAITMKNAVLEMLTHCCSGCAKCKAENVLNKDFVKFDNNTLNSDIIFPVISKPTIEKVHGFHFLPLLAVPSSYYFTLKKSDNKVIKEIVQGCLKMWPLLLMCLMFASMSGFIVWIIETHTNVENFPRHFYVGMFDGFWWSLVTMTTVGYGDKAIKTPLGRIYAVFWILLGIILCSILTGTVTSEIMQARSPANTEMKGVNVGVLKQRLHDVAIVTQHGGIVHTGNISHTMKGINELIAMLESGSVSGFLIDRNTYFFMRQRIQEKKYMHIADKLNNLNMVKTEKFHKGAGLSCGILLKHQNDYNYFKAHSDNNFLHFESCTALRINTKRGKDEDEKVNLFATCGLLKSILYYSLGAMGIMLLIGILAEGRHYKKNSVELTQTET